MISSKYDLHDVSFTNVADMFLNELRNGNVMSIDLLKETFPHLAEEIESQIPALALLEKTIGQSTEPVQLTGDKELGGCSIVRELGRGAVGVVYEAIQNDIGRRVAVKVIPIAGAAAKASVERFELERRAMGRVEHPNIVPVYSYGHDAKHAYLVMKLIDGHSLYDLQSGAGDYRAKFQLSELVSDWQRLAEVGATIASGLQHAHESGLVHRDIKPANLLLGKDGRIWITDFGLAKIYDYARSLSRTGDAIGTPRYMAPEQLRGVCDARSDVYSLGITLYELAAGQKAWGDRSNVALLTQRDSITLQKLTELRKDIPEDLSRIIMKACEFSPEDRYQTAQEMEIVLNRFREGHLPSDRRKRKREPDDIFRQKFKKRMILTACGGAFGTFVIAFGALTYANRTSVVATAPVTEIASVPAEEKEKPFKKATVGLLDKLADDNNEDMVNIVTDFLHESIDESGKNLHFSDQTREKIDRQIQYVGTQIKEKGLSEESLDKFLKSYRKTSLPVATRVMRLTIIVNKSGLSQSEKASAIRILQYLACAVANDAISAPQADRYIFLLTGENVSTTEEVAGLYVDDSHLRGWLGNVSKVISNIPPGSIDLNRVSQDLERVLHESFDDQSQNSNRRTRSGP